MFNADQVGGFLAGVPFGVSMVFTWIIFDGIRNWHMSKHRKLQPVPATRPEDAVH